MYLADTMYYSGTGCGNENFVDCLLFQSGIHSQASCTLNGEDIGTIAENGSCFNLPIWGISSVQDFPTDPTDYPLQVISLLNDQNEETSSDFYVNSPLELIHQIRAFIPDVRIWLGDDGYPVIGDDVDDPDNFIYLIGTVKNSQGEEWLFNIGNLIVDDIISVIAVPSLLLYIPAGDNVLEIYDPNTQQSKTMILSYDYVLPEIENDLFTYDMPLGQSAIFPLSSDDLCNEIVSIENICPELSTNEAVVFTLQDNQSVKFKAEGFGTSYACYEMCEQSGRCDTFNLCVEVYLPDIEPEEEILTAEDSLAVHNLYPNPAFSTVYFTEPLDIFIKKITIYDSVGKRIDEVRLSETNTYDLYVSRYAEGLYIAVRHLDRNMRLVYILFFSLLALGLSAQTYSLDWSNFAQSLQNSTLIESCDTVKVTLNLSETSTSEADFPFTITRQGTATAEDIWTNIENDHTVEFTNPVQEINILPYEDDEVDTGKELKFRVESALGEVKTWTVFLYDEFEEFEIIANSWGNLDSLPCTNDIGFDLMIEQTADEIDVHNNYYSYQWTSGEASAVGTSVYIGLHGEFYIEGNTVSVEIFALNCSQTVYQTYPQGYNIILDTFACRSSVPVEFMGEFFQNNFNYNAATKRLDLVAENGCDSIVFLRVHWLANETRTEVIYKEADEIIDFNGMPITEYGNYESLAQTWQGCDSNYLLTVLPIEIQSDLTYLPDSITSSTVSCINETCLPIYLPNLEDYTISLDEEIINPVFTNDCQMYFDVFDFNGVDYLLGSGSDNYGIDYIIYNDDTLAIDFNFRNIDELVGGLNYYLPDFPFTKSQDSEDIYLLNVPSDFERLRINLLDRLTGFTYLAWLNGWSNNPRGEGLYFSTEPGIKNLKIRHNTTGEEKLIIADFKPLIYPIPTDTTIFEYYPEIGQRVSFPLWTNELCLDFSSVEMTCPQNWEDLVDYTLDDTGDFTFKPLKPYNSTGCFRLCDDLGICKEILMKLKFEGLQVDPTQFSANIYPNPTSDILTITTKLGVNIRQINVFNVAGQFIDEFIPFPRNYAEVDLSRYAEGLYFIQVMTAGGEDLMKKIVVQR